MDVLRRARAVISSRTVSTHSHPVIYITVCRMTNQVTVYWISKFSDIKSHGEVAVYIAYKTIMKHAVVVGGYCVGLG